MGNDVCCCHWKLKSAGNQNLPRLYEEKHLASVRSCPCVEEAAGQGASALTVRQSKMGSDFRGRDRMQSGWEVLS